MTYHLELAHSAWFFVLGFLILSLMAWWVYRTTVPPVSPLLRRLLMSLRLLAGSLLLLLVFEPIFGISIRQEEKPVVALLVDTSASMGLPASSSGEAPVRRVLRGTWMQNLQSRYRVVPIAFADSAEVVNPFHPDSLRFDNEGTNLSLALKFAADRLAGSNFSAALLLTDGIYNLGGDPVVLADRFPAPIFTVPLGKDEPERDIWIEDVITNERAFANSSVPVEVVVRSTGFGGRPAVLQLTQGDQPLVSKTVRLPQDLSELKVRLDFVPETIGMNKYEVTISSEPGEITDRNNRQTLYINVLKSKLTVAVVAGAPGPDVSFLLRALRSDQNLTVKPHIFLDANRVLESPLPARDAIKKLDCVIGVNLFTAPASAPKLVAWLRQAVVEEKKPFIYIMGPVSATRDLWNAAELLLFAGSPAVAQERLVSPQAEIQGLIHPILRTNDDSQINRQRLEDLPPVFTNLSRLRLHAGAQVLMSARDDGGARRESGGQPLLATIRQGERRAVAFLGAGYWRWHLMMQRLRPGDRFYEQLMLNAVRWAVSAEESKLLKVATNKEIYRTGEEILFTAQAYYEDFTPRDGLEITVDVQGAEASRRIFLEGRGKRPI